VTSQEVEEVELHRSLTMTTIAAETRCALRAWALARRQRWDAAIATPNSSSSTSTLHANGITNIATGPARGRSSRW
jgi:hypothetical protein